jgi:molybdopterin synthase catalytic subunit
LFLSSEPIDLAAFLGEARPSDGAVCVFVGVVRNESHGRQSVAVEYQAYGAMAESEMARIADSLTAEWPGVSLRIRHRVGRLAVGEPSVAIVATAPHREEAFAACREAIERVKTTVPIWKREIRPDGSSEWVDPTRG